MSSHFPDVVSEPQNYLTVSGAVDQSRRETVLHLSDGRVIRIPTAMLIEGLESSMDGPMDLRSISSPAVDSTEDLVIPIVEEQISIGRKTVATGKVLLQKGVTEYEETLDEPLAVRTFDIERVALNRPVESAPAVRVEGDTTVYPLVEEQLILTKRLILKEEVRVTKRDTERRDTRVVTLRREHLIVERTLPD